MKLHRVCFRAAIMMLAAILPLRALPQATAPADETQELRKLVAKMQTQMDKMQAEIDQLKGVHPPTVPEQPAPGAAALPAQQAAVSPVAQLPVGATTSQHVGQATAERQEFSEDNLAAARLDNVPLDPKYKGYFRLPGTQMIMKIGGYFKTDFIYDLKPAGNTDAFVPSSFPIPQPVDVNNATISVRPTRLSVDFRAPITSVGDARFYVEADFFGTNSTTPRLRHAYTQAGNILLGPTFSNFMDPDAFPDTLDFQGPNGIVSIRNPQFRYSFGLTPSLSLYISAEKPSSDVIFKTAQFSAQPNAPAPDGAIRLRQEFERGHIQVASVFRSIAAYLPNGRSDSVFGWGVDGALVIENFGQ